MTTYRCLNACRAFSTDTPANSMLCTFLWKCYSSSVIVLLQVRLASSLFLNVKNNTVVRTFFCHCPTTLNVWVKIRSNRYKSFFSRLLFATAYGKMTMWAWRRRVKDWNDSNLFVCWLLNVPATGECISGTDLLRQLYVLSHWDRSCGSNVLPHPVTVYWHRADQSQCWPYNARRLAG